MWVMVGCGVLAIVRADGIEPDEVKEKFRCSRPTI